MVDQLEPFEIETEGSREGINPFFGEWTASFDFPPVSHFSKGEARKGFSAKVSEHLGSQFLFTGEIKVEITIFLDEQTVTETDATADLDNFTKSILDALKESDGMMVDDSQIQSLQTSWLDINDEKPRFEVRIHGHPDEFMLKQVELYQMPDKLWYPISNRTWNSDGPREMSPFDWAFGLSALRIMTGHTRKFRATLRRNGMTRLQAFRETMKTRTPARGFHRSRIEGNFPIHDMASWEPRLKAFLQSAPEEAESIQKSVDQIDRSLAALRGAFDAKQRQASETNTASDK